MAKKKVKKKIKRKKVKKKKYLYKAEILRVIDGDTFRVQLDLGFRTFRDEIIRLRNVDTPEIKGKEREKGLKVKEHVKELIEGKKVLLETFKIGKYGRYVCEIYLAGEKKPLSRHLLRKKFARKVDW